MSLFTNHIVAFFLIFGINENNYNLLKNKINKNFFLRKLMIIVTFFHICLWTLSQTAGLKVGGNISEVFETSLFTEMQTILKGSYNFIRINFIYTLPKLPMHS
jgi:cytosine/uracil/thiamine/allantoin permease